MSIPVNALKDDELLHYAALDPGAATELVRRIADNSIDPSAEREELREDVRILESRAEDTEDEINELHSQASTACEFIRRAMNPDERVLSVNELLQKHSTVWSKAMSTFAVFGMTRDVAIAEAKKTVKTTRPDPKRSGHNIELTIDDWMYKVGIRADQIMAGAKVRQLSPLFDAPQYAEQFIELARKSGKCRDMRIRAKRTLAEAQGEPIINPKTKAPKVGFTEWPLKQQELAD